MEHPELNKQYLNIISDSVIQRGVIEAENNTRRK